MSGVICFTAYHVKLYIAQKGRNISAKGVALRMKESTQQSPERVP